MSSKKEIKAGLTAIARLDRSPLEHLPQPELIEKLITLELQGPPEGLQREETGLLADLARSLSEFEVKDARVVVFGGGTGLSNIIGGDSRKASWPDNPFSGLKEIFPRTKAVVCVTDDGGSTGELLKDLPFIALGDLRHVLLSSLRKEALREMYGLDRQQCKLAAAGLHQLFNHRFAARLESIKELTAAAALDSNNIPQPMKNYFTGLLELLFSEPVLSKILSRPHCLGNLLLAAAIWQGADELQGAEDSCLSFDSKNYSGLKQFSRVLALEDEAVMPCSLTPAGLQILYTNGALVTGEYKSGHTRRNYPVDRLFVRFAEEPQPMPEVIRAVKEAEVIVLAPGSLYTSTIPIFQVPGLAESVRNNKNALKILVTNLWVQKGETDVVRDDPKRRFHVSDLIKAYNRNIPGGVEGLFTQVLALGLQDVSGSILQNYAMEDKVPIYLDRKSVAAMGFKPIEAGIYSLPALIERNVIQHDPAMVARTIRTLYAVAGLNLPGNGFQDQPAAAPGLPGYFRMARSLVQAKKLLPCQRYAALNTWLEKAVITTDSGQIPPADRLATMILDILWYHQDISPYHLNNVNGVRILEKEAWSRSQEWDNLYSFYDPDDKTIKMCRDVIEDSRLFQQALLIALGQALLGNYAASKKITPVEEGGESVGKIYHLVVKEPELRNTLLTDQDLVSYLQLARMIRSDKNRNMYTRLINGTEGFTPPGLLFGLIYAWYLDNRYAAHVEYKMAVMRTDISDLIPEQIKMFARRKELVTFFRQAVFGHTSPVYDESPVVQLNCS